MLQSFLETEELNKLERNIPVSNLSNISYDIEKTEIERVYEFPILEL